MAGIPSALNEQTYCGGFETSVTQSVTRHSRIPATCMSHDQGAPTGEIRDRDSPLVPFFLIKGSGSIRQVQPNSVNRDDIRLVMTLVGRLIRIRIVFSSYPSDRLMRTRSATRNAADSKMLDTPTATPSTLGKREADTELTKNTKKLARADAEQPQPASDTTLVPAVLTFDFQEAKRHLIQADHRFEDLFQRMTCKPFEQLERVHPYRYDFRCPHNSR
jgi:hypothetical protein